jgi:hypothetical protein
VELSGGDAARLKLALMWCSNEDIITFDLRPGAVLNQLDREDIHDVTDDSPDGFLYVRRWIISRGREYVAAVLADPQAAPQAEDDPDEYEEFMYAPMETYEALVGEGTWSDTMRDDEPRRGWTGANAAAWPSLQGNEEQRMLPPRAVKTVYQESGWRRAQQAAPPPLRAGLLPLPAGRGVGGEDPWRGFAPPAWGQLSALLVGGARRRARGEEQR